MSEFEIGVRVAQLEQRLSACELSLLEAQSTITLYQERLALMEASHAELAADAAASAAEAAQDAAAAAEAATAAAEHAEEAAAEAEAVADEEAAEAEDLVDEEREESEPESRPQRVHWLHRRPFAREVI